MKTEIPSEIQITQNRQIYDVKNLEPVWAYALLGALAGTFPPMLLFTIWTFADSFDPENGKNMSLTGLFLTINVICAVVGTGAGAIIGVLMMLLRKIHWAVPIAVSPIFGAGWALVTGGAGGFPAFVIGAFVGIAYAAPFGILGFLIFSFAYESLARRRDLKWWEVVATAFAVLAAMLAGMLVMYASALQKIISGG